ncbi:FdhF/YdeP family oxidoreductase [Thermoflexibacter ruber]|uniref:Oxidoreductase alpha (Molybdopterin) subunit n=1 Tax=Thermoflexibacter ruber TaxID=1003 RepID=A0A1I2EKQ2_9BACT|nr:FdhF/YdeP family oxidoreductase [Thermoflexibacter ruber]SFE93694.1 oxidoreductase alpha (molybdopterin) subunit [Thermoflexibacter ruber]
MQDKPHAQPPEKLTGLTLTEPKDSAAGLTAVLSTAKHILEEMNLSKGVALLSKLNQKGGIDCMSCAFPDPKERSAVAEYCENGAKAIAEEATDKRITADFFANYSVEELSEQSDYWLGKQGRLTQPMILRAGEKYYKPITWEEAFAFIAKQLNALSSPHEAIFYTSGRTSNEAAFLYQLFVRQFGTNNLPDCSNMCHESSGVALSDTLGIGKGSVILEDFEKAEIIMIIGQNPGTNHPRMLSALQKAKKKGVKIISINPLKETGLLNFKHPQNPIDWVGKGTELTDLYLQVKINGDVALLKALILCILENENLQTLENWSKSANQHHSERNTIDYGFIQTQTTGFEDFITDLKKYNLEYLVEQSGVSIEEIKKAADLLKKYHKIIACWAMGLTQHKNAVGNIQEIVNLLLLKGSIGKEGAGTCPVRGHSNVQGDRTMGIVEKPKPEFLDRLGKVFNFTPPQQHGYDTVAAIKAMYEGTAKVFIALGGNFLSATPDTEYTAKALQNCDLTVHISTKLNRSHLIHGKNALILPCLGRTEKDVQASGEQFVSVENSMGIVHSSQGILPPASKFLLSEASIVAGLAKATLGEKSTVNWDKMIENYDNIRDKIEQVIVGFENYNQRVRHPDGFYLPNGAREGKFHTKDKKAHFTINELPKHELQEDEFLMMTIRSHDQFNTTIYGLNDRYRGIFNERRVVLINPQDMKKFAWQAQQVVDLYSKYHGEERIAKTFVLVPYDIPQQCIATYFPEANVLVPIDLKADKSHTPVSKSVIVKIIAK